MTRDERIAAGWVECWVVKAPHQRTYSRGLRPEECGHWTGNLREAFKFSTRDDAFDWIFEWHKEMKGGHGLHIIRAWTRKKPKAPPGLKVGDEVVVRGKVVMLGTGAAANEVCVEWKTYKRSGWVYEKDAERVKQ